MNVNTVLEWIKAHALIVVFVFIMIAAAVGLPYYASSRNAEIRSDVEARAALFRRLEDIGRTSLPDGQTGVVNERLLEAYREVVEANRREADEVYKRALQYNRKGRDVIMSTMFPSPPPSQREVLPKRFHDRWIQAYEQLLEEVGAGSPPAPQDLLPQLERRAEQICVQEFAKPQSRLTAEERTQLGEKLSNLRMRQYADRAERIRIYADLSAFSLREWNQAQLPSLSEMWEWQWQYWTDHDVMHALTSANADSPSVLQAPVKRVISITSMLMPPDGGSAGAGDGGARAGGASPPGTRGIGGVGRRRAPGAAPAGRNRGSGGGGGSAPAGTAPNPASPVTPTFSASLTGRVSNSLYDVRTVHASLIVETAKIPRVLDSIAAYNFMTVTNVQVNAGDAFADLREGYFYGDSPISRVDLTIETIWLREWTSEFMPEDVRITLGLPASDPADASTG